MLINFNNYNNNLINYDNKINLRLINHHYKSQTKTQINLLTKKCIRTHIKKTIKALKTSIEIRSKSSLLLLKSIISTIKKIRF